MYIVGRKLVFAKTGVQLGVLFSQIDKFWSVTQIGVIKNTTFRHIEITVHGGRFFAKNMYFCTICTIFNSELQLFAKISRPLA
jgi:hypothetical protein